MFAAWAALAGEPVFDGPLARMRPAHDNLDGAARISFAPGAVHSGVVWMVAVYPDPKGSRLAFHPGYEEWDAGRRQLWKMAKEYVEPCRDDAP